MRGTGEGLPPLAEEDALVRELFEQALELPSTQRPRFVAERAGARSELSRAVATLLEHEARLGRFPLPRGPRPAARAPRGLLLAPGERLGDYEVVSFLAGGGGGQVFCARQLSLGGRRVALKVVEGVGLGAGDRERFLRGAEVAAGLHHPSLVPVYASGEDA